MIRHHAQALRMTALVPTHSGRKDMALLARRMDVSQQSELEVLRSWLKARGAPAPEPAGGHGGAAASGQAAMPGMLTELELTRLEAARGRAFDRLFLRLMVRHHEGALTMVSDLFAANDGNEPEVSALARHVDADQRVEIARMRRLLERLAAP